MCGIWFWCVGFFYCIYVITVLIFSVSKKETRGEYVTLSKNVILQAM